MQAWQFFVHFSMAVWEVRLIQQHPLWWEAPRTSIGCPGTYDVSEELAVFLTIQPALWWAVGWDEVAAMVAVRRCGGQATAASWESRAGGQACAVSGTAWSPLRRRDPVSSPKIWGDCPPTRLASPPRPSCRLLVWIATGVSCKWFEERRKDYVQMMACGRGVVHAVRLTPS